jgi:hypothetical protein
MINGFSHPAFLAFAKTVDIFIPDAIIFFPFAFSKATTRVQLNGNGISIYGIFFLLFYEN